MNTTLLLHSLRTMCFALTLSAALNPAYAQRDMADPSAPVNKSVAEWQAQADAGDAAALRAIGEHYNKGTGGVGVDYKKVVEYYEKAAEKGNVASQTNMGDAYRDGKYVKKDDKISAAWYAKAAAQNDVVAIHNLSLAYLKGVGVGKDEKRAHELAMQAAGLNFLPSLVQVAFDFDGGRGATKDPVQANAYFKKAAELNSPTGQLYYGYALEDGSGGVAQDKKAACNMYLRAADNDHVDAMFSVGLCYFQGRAQSQWSKDGEKAMMWMQRSADKGSGIAAQYAGEMYRDGLVGISENKAKARVWFQKGAELGNMNSQASIGLMYAIGDGGSRDLRQARFWWEKAAAQGDKNSAANLKKL
jgi:uncharacterized protein